MVVVNGGEWWWRTVVGAVVSGGAGGGRLGGRLGGSRLHLACPSPSPRLHIACTSRLARFNSARRCLSGGYNSRGILSLRNSFGRAASDTPQPALDSRMGQIDMSISSLSTMTTRTTLSPLSTQGVAPSVLSLSLARQCQCRAGKRRSECRRPDYLRLVRILGK